VSLIVIGRGGSGESWWSAQPARSQRRFQAVRILVGIVGGLLPIVATSCAFQSQVPLRFKRDSGVEVTESLKAQYVPHQVHGVTQRDGQIVGIDCTATVVYNVQDVTGPAFLPQSLSLSLRSRPLPKGTPFRLVCDGPLVVEIPANAAALKATATNSTGRRSQLEVQGSLSSLPLAFGRRMQAEPEMQFVRLGFSAAAKAGDYQPTFTFTMPDRSPFHERALVTASVLCGRSHYLQPIVPPIDNVKQVPEFEIHPSSASAQIQLPRIAGASLTKTIQRPLAC
jgi:hypothetical protein